MRDGGRRESTTTVVTEEEREERILGMEGEKKIFLLRIRNMLSSLSIKTCVAEGGMDFAKKQLQHVAIKT
jgi:hypothetical protein